MMGACANASDRHVGARKTKRVFIMVLVRTFCGAVLLALAFS